jgi:hypothetical protein
MWRIVFGLLVFTMPLTSCGTPRKAIPDQTIPHQLAAPIPDAQLWVRLPDGSMTKTTWYIPEGWWCAGPPVVEATPSR